MVDETATQTIFQRVLGPFPCCFTVITVTLKFAIHSYLRQAIIVAGESPGVKANVWECSLEVNEFELQSRSYVHFRTNTQGKGLKPFIHSAMS